MECVGAGLEDGVDVAAAVAALGGVIQRSLDFEFLNYGRIGQRSGGEFGDVVVGGADALDLVVVVVFALAVDLDADVAASELRGGIEFALSAAGESEQLLEVLRGERQGADGSGVDGLAGGGVAGVDFLHFGLHLNFLLHRLGFQFGDDARGFGDANINVAKVDSGRSRHGEGPNIVPPGSSGAVKTPSAPI